VSRVPKSFQSMPTIDGTCIDLERAREQQEALVKCLRGLDIDVLEMAPDEDSPTSVYTRDCASPTTAPPWSVVLAKEIAPRTVSPSAPSSSESLASRWPNCPPPPPVSLARTSSSLAGSSLWASGQARTRRVPWPWRAPGQNTPAHRSS